MNVPLGTPVTVGKQLTAEIVHDISSFMDGNKTGYFVITIQGRWGIEEGLLIIEAGGVVGSHYEYLRFGREYFAGEALKRCLNMMHAPRGVYDAYTLTAQQLELLKIFNEQTLLLERVSQRGIEGMIPLAYTDEFEKAEYLPPEVEREEVLKKRGLEEIKVDVYQTVARQVEKALPTPGLAEKMAAEVESYLTGKPVPAPQPTQPAEVKEVRPAIVPVPKEPGEEKAATLSELDAQAERLKKLLKK
jgi:hypothetical protein